MALYIRSPFSFKRDGKPGPKGPRRNTKPRDKVEKAANEYIAGLIMNGTDQQKMALAASRLSLPQIPVSSKEEDLREEIVTNALREDKDFQESIKQIEIAKRQREVLGDGYNHYGPNGFNGFTPEGFEGLGGYGTPMEEMASNLKAMKELASEMGYDKKQGWFDGEVAASLINVISSAFAGRNGGAAPGNGHTPMVTIHTDTGPRQMTIEQAERHLQLQENKIKRLSEGVTQAQAQQVRPKVVIQDTPAPEIQSETVIDEPTPETTEENIPVQPSFEAQDGVQDSVGKENLETDSDSVIQSDEVEESPGTAHLPGQEGLVSPSTILPNMSLASWAPYLDDTQPVKFADILMTDNDINNIMHGTPVNTPEGTITQNFLDFFITAEPDVLIATLEQAKAQADPDTWYVLERLTTDKTEWMVALAKRLKEINKDIFDENE